MKNIIVICFIAALLVACQSGDQKRTYRTIDEADTIMIESNLSDDDEATTVVGNTTWTDSMRVGDNLTTTVTWSVQCPIRANAALRQRIIKWIALEAKDSAATSDNISTIISSSGRKQMLADCKEMEQKLNAKNNAQAQYAHDKQISIHYEDAEYITLLSTSYDDMGGAHGSYTVHAATFHRKSGEMLGWNLLPQMAPDTLRHKIKEGLKEYFKVKTDDELRDNLILYSADSKTDPFADPNFPLPSNPPFVTAQDVEIIYQPYEIAPYSAGLPTCVIR